MMPDSTTGIGQPVNRIEARNAATAIGSKPPWIKTRFRSGPNHADIRNRVARSGLNTVCQQAGCPNIGECWEDREATFLIGGDVCTRRCDFCQIDSGKPGLVDHDEPRRVARAVAEMGLNYSTVTGVARDDLPDGGASLYAATVRAIHAQVPECGVEVLVPDFVGNRTHLAEVFGSQPEVLAHNLETVPRLLRRIRPAFRYDRSLDVLTAAREAGLTTKSNLILGLGELDSEIHATMADLLDAGCQMLTITQYLRPTARHYPVQRWVHPDEFDAYGAHALSIGFLGVMSGPLVRSSYRAGTLRRTALATLRSGVAAPVPSD